MGLAFDCEVDQFARHVDFLDDFFTLQKGLYLGVCLGCRKNRIFVRIGGELALTTKLSIYLKDDGDLFCDQ